MDLFALTPAARGFYAAAACAAAHELGLFARLAAPRTAAELAAALEVAPRRLGALLDALCLEGVLRRVGPAFARGAVPPAPALPRDGWGRLAEVLRADRPLPAGPLDGFHEHLATAGAAAARELAALLADRSGPLLDLGGGAGAYTVAWLEARPHDRALLVDRAEVCALAAPRLAGFGAHAATRAGDLFACDLGAGHGVTLLANVLHLYPADAGRALVARAAAAVAPGGAVAVVDLAIAPDRSGPPAGVYFALNMALYTEAGTVHDAGTIASWLADAGLRPEPPRALAAAPESFLLIAVAA